MMKDSGTYRQHLKGEAAYRSFIPLSLWEAVEKEDDELIPWYEEEEIKKAVERTKALLRQVQKRWVSLDPEKQEILRDELLRREAEASVCMAYPRLGAPPALAFTDVGRSNDVPLQLMNLMGVQQSASAETLSLLDSIPEELRGMADEDVENFCEAGNRSLEMMRHLPLSGRLLKDLHYIVLFARHYDKMYRGEFRRSPVWIGENGQDLRSAAFVPPVDEDMIQAFSDLETFLHYKEEVDPLVKAALIHYQFETIHPFIDGNGRIGRLLILLYLEESLDPGCPWIPFSEILLQGIDRYYKEIRTLQLYGDYSRWTLWFLGMLNDAVKRAFVALS